MQGGIDTQRRLRHMAEITALDFDGYALGGLAVGENIADTYRVLDEVAYQMPTERPRWAAWLFNQATVGRYYPEEKHPISRILFAVYEPACRFVDGKCGPQGAGRIGGVDQLSGR